MAQCSSELGSQSTQSSYIEHQPMAQPSSKLGSHQAMVTSLMAQPISELASQYFIAVAPNIHNQAMLTSSQPSP